MRELQAILNAAVTRLEADADDTKTVDLKDFAEIISEDKGDIDKEILQAVTTLSKVSVLVMLRSASSDSPNVQGPVLDDVELWVEVAEAPVLNRKGTDGEDYMTALDVAQVVASTDCGLHLYQDESTGITFLIETGSAFLKPTPPPRGATTAYSIYFKATGVMTGTDS